MGHNVGVDGVLPAVGEIASDLHSAGRVVMLTDNRDFDDEKVGWIQVRRAGIVGIQRHLGDVPVGSRAGGNLGIRYQANVDLFAVRRNAEDGIAVDRALDRASDGAAVEGRRVIVIGILSRRDPRGWSKPLVPQGLSASA